MIRIRDKKKFIRGTVIIAISTLIIILLIIGVTKLLGNKEEEKQVEDAQVKELLEQKIKEENKTIEVANITTLNQMSEWNLKVVNKYNQLEEGYEIQLVDYDKNTQFDKRAISYLKDMINDMLEDDVKSVWVQSAYRSYEKQKQLFENKVNEYIKQGNTQEEAEELAQKLVQKPEASEHHLGLAVDFNYVNDEFEDTEAFTWLSENAAEYGFILRYPKDKEEITGVTYEPWHWRYVGEQHSKKIKQQGVCLEEYVYNFSSSV